MTKTKVLLVEDEAIFRRETRFFLEEKGYDVAEAEDGEKALDKLHAQEWDLVLLDLALPGIGGIEVLEQITEMSSELPVLILTAFASLESAIQALRLGAFDYLLKPIHFDDLELRLQRVAKFKSIAQENQVLKGLVRERYQFHEMIGKSSAIQEVFADIEKLQCSQANVLISGESGVGKELVARAIHQHSPHRERTFLPINISAIPETMLESQLFGHLRGAFTGATQRRRGIFQAVQGGTVFLDEIGELPLELQPRLLRTLEEHEILPLGADGPVQVDFRLIAATNRDLSEMVEQGRFREDLFYRLHVFHLKIPPLRARKEDIPLFVNHFVASFALQMKKKLKGVKQEAMQDLLTYRWKGNIRELKNVLERAVILAEDGGWISSEHLPSFVAQKEPGLSFKLKEVMEAYEKEHITMVLKLMDFDKEKAGQMLGLSLATLYRRLEKYDLLSQP